MTKPERGGEEKSAGEAIWQSGCGQGPAKPFRKAKHSARRGYERTDGRSIRAQVG